MPETARCDLSVFKEAIRAMIAVPKRYASEVVNSATMKVLIGSGTEPGLVQLTPKAEKQKILNDLTQNGLVYKLAAKALARTGYTGSRQNALAKMALKIINARVKSRAYIAAGWLIAAKKLKPLLKGGGKGLTSKTLKILPRGDAKDSYVIPATATRHSADVFNSAVGADEISNDYLVQKAIDNSTSDMLVYIERKFGAAIADAIKGGSSAETVLPN